MSFVFVVVCVVVLCRDVVEAGWMSFVFVVVKPENCGTEIVLS